MYIYLSISIYMHVYMYIDVGIHTYIHMCKYILFLLPAMSHYSCHLLTSVAEEKMHHCSAHALPGTTLPTDFTLLSAPSGVLRILMAWVFCLFYQNRKTVVRAPK